MKEVWSIFVGNLKELPAEITTLGVGVIGVIALGMATRIVVSFFHMIQEIFTAFA